MFGGHEPAAGEGEGNHRHIDQEERSPVEVGQQPAAQQRAQDGPHERQGGPDGNGQGTFALVVEAHTDECQGGREHGRRTHCLQDTRRDQHAHRTGKGGQQGGQSEDQQACQKGAPVADAVAQGAGAEQQARGKERVGIDDPQPLGGAGVQVVREHRQGREQDGDVHGDQQQAQTDHEQQQPAPGAGRALVRAWCDGCGRCGARAWGDGRGGRSGDGPGHARGLLAGACLLADVSRLAGYSFAGA